MQIHKHSEMSEYVNSEQYEDKGGEDGNFNENIR